MTADELIDILPAACQRDPETGRQLFNAVLADLTDPDQIARVEFAREYFCNPTFAAWTAGTVWAMTEA